MQRNTFRLVCTLGTGLVLGCATISPADAFWGAQYGATCSDACNTCNTGNTCNQGCSVGRELHDHLETGRQANAMWPYPYICQDREWTHTPFDIMVVNGWRRQNLLGAHHFDSQTGKLTRAGQLKVQWILTQTPPDRRQIFVERSIDANETDVRLATAKAFAAGLNIDGGEALVIDTNVRSASRPAHMVDAERTSFIEGRPPAVLPTGTTTSAGSN